MTESGKRSAFVARLSTSKDTITKTRSKCRGIWSIIKQVWYVPFIWSLAWFSYWIFQESITLGQSITQSSTSNQIGLAISIVAVLIAGYMSGKAGEKNVEKNVKVGIEKKNHFNFLKKLIRRNSAETILPEELVENIQSDKSEGIENRSTHYLQIETNHIRNPDEPLKTSFQASDSNSNTRNKVNLPHHIERQETPSECLICPNLVSCDQRGKVTFDSATPCPYAKDNRGRHPS